MKVSLFTPTHNPKYLTELYNSIKYQDFFEWVIVPNDSDLLSGGYVYPGAHDPRVKLRPYAPKNQFIGELKNYACSQCTGEILLEVDHDDLLTPDAIEEVKMAFSDPEIGFVYSNHAEFRGDFKPGVRFNAAFGWKWRPFTFNGKNGMDEVVAFEPTPASVSRIWYAPHHLRAWRRNVYEAIGGHKENMRVLDDQEIMARTYVATKMKHIDKCLYLYRLLEDGENSWLKFNKEIQDNVMRLYEENIFGLALRWAELNGLKKLDFGGNFNQDPRLENIDLATGFDLNKGFPFADNSVGVIRANDILEHITDKLQVIREIYRVLAPGGYFFCMVPSALSQGAFQDPTHVSFYVENSFKYYTEARFGLYIGMPVRFQAMRLYTTPQNKDGVSWVVAHLVALKGQEACGMVEI